ncbi:MAG: helix-turn-helix transcriptional regulator [Thaumarchaeota archaeon]|nr:MAG: helix-turn-helix transcriptional regulator [Nitrososphaerota archaeon]
MIPVGGVLPSSQHRSSRDLEPEEAPHLWDIDDGHENLAAAPLDHAGGRLDILYEDVVDGGGSLLWARPTYAPAGAAGRLITYQPSRGRLDLFQVPLEDFLEECARCLRVGAGEFRVSEHPCHALEIQLLSGPGQPETSSGIQWILFNASGRGDVTLRAERGPRLAYQADPIRESLKVLGAKWSLLILRDIAFLGLHRFGEIRRNNPGLTARVLSRRLRQMVAERLLERTENGRGEVAYNLTSRGEDAVYILLAVLRYGIRHHMRRGTNLTEEDAMRELHYRSPFENPS